MTEKNHNLVVRVVTALVLLPLILWLIALGGFWFALLVSAAAALCAVELNLLPLSALMPAPAATAADEGLSRKQRKKRESALREEISEVEAESSILSGAAIVSAGGAFLIPFIDEAPLRMVSVNLILVAVILIAFADALLFEQNVERAPRRVSMALLGAAYPGLMMSALVRLRQLPDGAWWIVLTLVVTWFNDTTAYFAGRAFGKRKLSPRISPSKTWEGAVGGGVGSVVGALVVQHFWLFRQLSPAAAALIGAGAAVVGPTGDLAESLLKRAYGAKDSGRLLPGHGGILDRVDALLFTGPFVLLCARLLT